MGGADGELRHHGLSKINLMNTLRQNWHLGVSAFGGPPVHFKIVGCLHVNRGKWKRKKKLSQRDINWYHVA